MKMSKSAQCYSGENSERDKPITNPVKAIRKHCLECSSESPREVELCAVTDCYLYPFRFGKNPYRAKRELTEEQKAAAAERLRKAREKKDNE